MRCSDCSAIIKPIVALDIDGTLADYHGHFIKFLEAYLGGHRVMRTYRGETGFKEWVCKNYAIDERTWRDVKLAYRQGGQKRSAPVYPYARVLSEKVADQAEVWLTTTRPYLRLDAVDPDTRFWLATHGINYHHLLYDKDKYDVLAEQVDGERVVAVLDDLPHQYDRAELLFGKGVPILSHTQYNDAEERLHQVHGLDYAWMEIERRLLEWREKHP